ncbi:hypothetical protein SAMN04489859_10204 [Paracoccus alcaliphilus]|uniref:Uncharacterized protein n=1 Tax=Paracoccus alcaliphilus TaxID=34002 RepID=A0A1H8K3J1_9RHOB|nr:hypothetical protein [Paracoccus alcaliphilus]WCR17498.1 hypothetical protein JHW40_14340 [Paracoccus alcaliphilus]SEN86968.1 hypothetical protein SAMN04489859_10204 [Paracoccus alcaliphilus]
MMRIIRQLCGKGRREAEADEELRRHKEAVAPEKRKISENVATVERLVRQLQKDTTAWH